MFKLIKRHNKIVPLREDLAKSVSLAYADFFFRNLILYSSLCSAKEIYSTIKMCATMQIIPKKMFFFPYVLVD